MKKKIIIIISIIFMSACGTSHRMKANRIDDAMLSGRYADIINNSEDLDLLDSLNTGKALFLIGMNEKSDSVLTNADKNLSDYFDSSIAKSTTKETTGALVNHSIHDYEPYFMDNLYINNYKILNALAMGDKSLARIEANRAYSKQQYASTYFDKEIDKANSQSKESMSKSEYSELNKKSGKILEEHYGDLSIWKGYKNYMNPYTTYLSGLYFMLDADGRSDYETASTYMKRTSGMVSKNSFVKSDLKMSEGFANNPSSKKTKNVWLIYENGMVAEFEQENITLPSFIVSRQVSVISFSMPKPKLRDQAFPQLKLGFEGSKKSVKTEILADIDSIFISEFNKNLPKYYMRAASQAIAKAALQYAASQADDDGWAHLAAIAYTLTTSNADLRSWHTLPKNVQIAKIPLEKNKKLQISTAEDTLLEEIEIKDESNYIVYIRIPSIMTKPIISIIKI